MAGTWSSTAERDLFLAVIGDMQLTGAHFLEAASKLEAKGYSFSASACQQRFNLLRRQAKAAEGTEGAETSPPKAKGSGTPSKRKKTGAADGNGENADGTPTKRKRRTKAEMEAARAMKNEQMGGPVKGEGGQDYYQGGSQEMQQSIEFDEAAEFNVGQYSV